MCAYMMVHSIPSSRRRRPPMRLGSVDVVDGGAIVVGGAVTGRERTVVVEVGLMLKTGN